MAGTAVIGLQWGDEAKGKIVDLLTEQFEIVVRYLGGANAGHTVVTGGEKYKLSLTPSGILRPNVQCVLTGGIVLHPPKLLSELDELRGRGIRIDSNLIISDRAHVIFPWHMEEERIFEARRTKDSGESIGTTMRGIGPCYQEKAGRRFAIRLGDLYRDGIEERIRYVVEEKNHLLSSLAGDDIKFTPLNADAILKEYAEHAEKLKPHLADTSAYLLDAIDADKKVLFEGAQGALLDVDHGTFPYVTSSNSSGVGIPAGSGVPGSFITKTIGILKAYNTRVGGGPMPTEDHGEIGDLIRTRGNEFGTVTGRPRRCGHFDAVAARYSARLSGATVLSIMLLDVLDALPELKVCVAYEINGERVTNFPSHVDDIRDAKAIYETFPGWETDTTSVSKFEDLPENAKAYVKELSRIIGRPIEMVSVGPDRDQTIFVPAEVNE